MAPLPWLCTCNFSYVGRTPQCSPFWNLEESSHDLKFKTLMGDEGLTLQVPKKDLLRAGGWGCRGEPVSHFLQRESEKGVLHIPLF